MSKLPENVLEDPGDVRAAARLVLRRRHGFENHAVIYVIVNLTIWLGVGLILHSWYPWSLLPACAGGIVLAFHAWFTFGPPNQPITEEAIDREVTRLTGRRPLPSVERPDRHEDYWTPASPTDWPRQRDAGSDADGRDVTRTPTTASTVDRS